MDSKVGAFHWLYESADVDDINKILETMEQRGMTIYGPREEDVNRNARERRGLDEKRLAQLERESGCCDD